MARSHDGFKQAVDLQTPCNGQKAARRAEVHARHHALPKRENASKGEAWASSQGCEDNHNPFKSVQVVRECPVPGSV